MRAPSKGYDLTIWADGQGTANKFKELKEAGSTEVPEAGKDFFVNEDLLQDPKRCPYGVTDVILYPDIPVLKKFRSMWILRRRVKPVVVVPAGGTPLPRRDHTLDEKAKLCSVYLRPWTLDKAIATDSVPYLRDLDKVAGAPREHAAGAEASQTQDSRSFRIAWKSYIRGSIVSDFATSIIQKFLSAVCSSGKLYEEEDEQDNNDCDRFTFFLSH